MLQSLGANHTLMILERQLFVPNVCSTCAPAPFRLLPDKFSVIEPSFGDACSIS